jgi:hypothetical protein
MSEWMEFDSPEPITVPIWIGRKRLDTNGNETKPTHVLKEASEATRSKWQSLATKGLTMQDGKVTMGANSGEVNALLISACLWECDEAGCPIKPVPEHAVRNMPSRITLMLSARAEEISGLKNQESPERKALIAALTLADGGLVRLDEFRKWASNLKEMNSAVYGPLWNLVKPTPEEEAKNSQ